MQSKTALRSILGSLAVVLALAMGGCERSDDESDVRVLNLDDHNYTVRLFRADDAAMVAERVVDIGKTVTFRDVDDGRYFVTITRIGAIRFQNRSSIFTIDDEDVFLTIDSSGNLND